MNDALLAVLLQEALDNGIFEDHYPVFDGVTIGDVKRQPERYARQICEDAVKAGANVNPYDNLYEDLRMAMTVVVRLRIVRLTGKTIPRSMDRCHICQGYRPCLWIPA